MKSYLKLVIQYSECAQKHDAIVAEELWDQVQAKLAKQGQGGSSRKVSPRTGVLAGLI